MMSRRTGQVSALLGVLYAVVLCERHRRVDDERCVCTMKRLGGDVYVVRVSDCVLFDVVVSVAATMADRGARCAPSMHQNNFTKPRIVKIFFEIELMREEHEREMSRVCTVSALVLCD